MISKQKAFQKTCSNYETKGKLRENVTSRYRTRITKTQCARGGTVQRLNHSARDPWIIIILLYDCLNKIGVSQYIDISVYRNTRRIYMVSQYKICSAIYRDFSFFLLKCLFFIQFLSCSNCKSRRCMSAKCIPFLKVFIHSWMHDKVGRPFCFCSVSNYYFFFLLSYFSLPPTCVSRFLPYFSTNLYGMLIVLDETNRLNIFSSQ